MELTRCIKSIENFSLIFRNAIRYLTFVVFTFLLNPCFLFSNPVTVSYTYSAKKPKQLEVIFTFQIAEGWHVYAFNSEIKPITIQWLALDKGIKKHTNWPLATKGDFYEGKFSVRSLLESDSSLPSEIIVNISWLACSGEQCVPGNQEVKILVQVPSARGNLARYDALGLLFAAFLGGLLLNFMPCVFPVLSLKVFRLIETQNSNTQNIKKSALFFTLGVIFTFCLLGGLVILLRATGQRLGWGFQLQNVHFLFFLCFLLYFMMLNFWGIFEFHLSMQVNSSPYNLFAENFLEGMLITFLSTPCTAPFMGAVIGLALLQPSVYSFFLFIGLGMGLAFPFQLISLSPSLRKYLPKPGIWMDRLKQFLGFPLLGTLLWLLWVLMHRTNTSVLFSVLMALAILSPTTWLWSWLKQASKKTLRVTAHILLIGVLIGMVWHTERSYSHFLKNKMVSSETGDDFWLPYSDETLERLLKKHQSVFIDVTAKWCLVCEANSRLVFENPEVRKYFQELNITPLKADWTDQNPTITRLLERFGRTGVPLYILYVPSKESPIILPTVLTPKGLSEILQASVAP